MYATSMKPTIGFIGQGWIGRNYADNFEERGFVVVRYSLDKKYKKNKEKVKLCQYVFVAVPTPSTLAGFDDSILIDAIKSATVKDQVVIIKSTIKIGTTEKIQKIFSDRFIVHSPEFLTEKTAKFDADYPERNIIGYTKKSKSKCKDLMRILPMTIGGDKEFIVPCKEAEFVKYMGNCWFYAKVIMMNLFYDISSDNKLNFESLKTMLGADSRVGKTHLDVIHQGGRGAGGDCFIKDMVALREMYEYIINTKLAADKSLLDHYYLGVTFLEVMEKLNTLLLQETNKDLKILKKVYG
jgi:nucleotide sugar dehydrogenase